MSENMENKVNVIDGLKAAFAAVIADINANTAVAHQNEIKSQVTALHKEFGAAWKQAYDKGVADRKAEKEKARLEKEAEKAKAAAAKPAKKGRKAKTEETAIVDDKQLELFAEEPKEEISTDLF